MDSAAGWPHSPFVPLKPNDRSLQKPHSICLSFSLWLLGGAGPLHSPPPSTARDGNWFWFVCCVPDWSFGHQHARQTPDVCLSARRSELVGPRPTERERIPVLTTTLSLHHAYQCYIPTSRGRNRPCSSTHDMLHMATGRTLQLQSTCSRL